MRTEYCESIDTVEWSPELQFVIFSHDTSKINQNEANTAIKEKISRKSNLFDWIYKIALSGQRNTKQHRQVEVKMVSLGQIFEVDEKGNKVTLGKLIIVLAQASDTALNSELVKTLVDYFYQENLQTIVNSCFLPFVGYFASIATFTSYFMISEEEETTAFKILKALNWLLAVTGTVYFGTIEVRQMMHKGRKYFTSFMNYIDLSTAILNLVLLSNHYLKLIVKDTTVILSFVAILSMWSNFIYWLRIFEPTTFYFDLIAQTMKDMSTFFIIFLLIVFACGNALYILNANRDRELKDNALYDEYFTEGVGFLSAILN